MPSPELIAEARRAMEVCNACRYCEGFCAVFPAMERRRSFTDADLAWLANLCHGCRGCFYACQYAPPHPFGINVPLSFAELRLESYAAYAWPKPLAVLFRNNGAVMALAMGLGVGLVVLLVAALQRGAVLFGLHPVEPGSFYAVIPYAAMAWPAGITALFSIVALVLGVRAYWRDAGTPRRAPGALTVAIHEATALTNLGGGGHGCNDRDDGFGMARRRLHHGVLYGFVLCLLSTCVGAVMHHLGHLAPYPFWSAPVLLGTVGGVGMLVGTVGMFWLRLTGDQAPTARRLVGPDVAMLTLLGMVALTGLALLALRATAAMGLALAIHLGFVLALFVTLPFSRLVHGLYRFAALLRNAIEARTMS
jgi:citrate/tricarballylate utilization protein